MREKYWWKCINDEMDAMHVSNNLVDIFWGLVVIKGRA
jgi:hypothetical protein